MVSGYDSAITIFSPDGHLFQVEYALEAVRKGNNAVAVRGNNLCALGIEKKALAKLQDSRTVRKICLLDDHICMTFAGLTADGRILANKARLECQNHKLTLEDSASVEYIARHISGIQQSYTQSGGVRPFGVSTLIVGFDSDGRSRLFTTEPSGSHSEWKANAIGPNSSTIREFLEKNYNEKVSASDQEVVKLTIKSLLEVVQSNSKNIEVAGISRTDGFKIVEADIVEGIIKEIESEREAEAAKKKLRRPTDGS
ncbi:proteasome subunit alpha type-7-like [Zophobas morio]|uniref:proteasome subunit alpha type-7-like n=1 Tax=Zophobas morio TaxID=2755281 RepID=UPI0030827615